MRAGINVRMMERPTERVSDALSSTGLVLNVAAVLGFALGLGSLSVTASMTAMATLVSAGVLFAASLVCFAVGGRRLDADRTAHVTALNSAAAQADSRVATAA